MSTSPKVANAPMTRRQFAAGVALLGAGTGLLAQPLARRVKAQIAITLDLEMSREYPRPGMTEWDYEKGNLDQPTKDYAEEAASIVRQHGGHLHFFCVGRVLEQPDVAWLKRIAAAGHPIGNHTYDHVNVKAQRPEEAQFRFRRAPWLIAGRTAAELIRDNIRLTEAALQQRVEIKSTGFRTPGGFANGIIDRPDVQQMLQELGFAWVSSKYPSHLSGKAGEAPGPEVYDSIVKAQAEAQPFIYPNGLIELPMSPISDVTAFRSNHWKLPWFLRAIRMAVGEVIRTKGVFDFLAHPSCLVIEDPKFESIKLICELATSAGPAAELADLNTISSLEP